MDRTEIEKELNSILKYANMVHKDDVDCIGVELLQSIMDLILKQEAEIERLKNANSELVDNLVFYKDKSYKLERNVDELKTEIKQEVKQAQIDVLNELKEKKLMGKNHTDIEALKASLSQSGPTYSYERLQADIRSLSSTPAIWDIDELIKEVQNVRT